MGGIFRLAEEAGFRLVASNLKSAVLAQYTPPVLLEHGSFIARVIASKSPVHIYRAGEAHLMALVKAGLTTALCAMLRSEELIVSISVGPGAWSCLRGKRLNWSRTSPRRLPLL